jgi:fucose 4-O-acetylase-like acetyltransferase
MGAMCWLAAPHWGKRGEDSRAGPASDPILRRPYVLWSLLLAAGIALATPPLWTTHRPRWLPWYLESYINGVHNLGVPQPWLFPIFPWVAFAFAGLAFGFLIFSPWPRVHENRAFVITGLAGAFLAFAGWWLDGRRMQIYRVYDFWHTSPNFFLIRTGVVLGIVFLAYAWCHWGAALKGFSPVIEMGRTSLFVYWLHLEFVYGRFSILRKGGQSILAATAGILAICAAMTIVAAIRNRTKGRGFHPLAFWRKPARATAG